MQNLAFDETGGEAIRLSPVHAGPIARLENHYSNHHNKFKDIIGESDKMKAVFELISNDRGAMPQVGILKIATKASDSSNESPLKSDSIEVTL